MCKIVHEREEKNIQIGHLLFVRGHQITGEHKNRQQRGKENTLSTVRTSTQGWCAPKLDDTMLGEGGRGYVAADTFFRGVCMWLNSSWEQNFGVTAVHTYLHWCTRTFSAIFEALRRERGSRCTSEP